MAGIYLYVYPTGRSTLMTYPRIIFRCLSLAGSLLPLSIMSGVPSEGIAPSVGQYGFVSTHSRSGRWTSVFFVQIYSTTRIFTLITVILSLVSFDDMAHYNCEVRMIRICFICGGDLIGRDPKVKTVFLFVSKPSDALNFK